MLSLKEIFSIIKDEGSSGITFSELIKKRQEKYHRKVGYTVSTKAVAELRRRGYVRIITLGTRRNYRIYPILDEEKQNRSEEVQSGAGDKPEQERGQPGRGPLTFYSAQGKPPKD